VLDDLVDALQDARCERAAPDRVGIYEVDRRVEGGGAADGRELRVVHRVLVAAGFDRADVGRPQHSQQRVVLLVRALSKLLQDAVVSDAFREEFAQCDGVEVFDRRVEPALVRTLAHVVGQIHTS